MKLRIGDTILVTKGKDRGRAGKVARAYPHEALIMIEGVNIKKKHERPRKGGEKGKIITIAHPFPAANAKLICPACKRPTRIGYSFSGEVKQRICKKCKAVVS